MIWHFSKLPILLQMFWVGALLMWIPAIHGTIVGNFDEARNFFYGGLLGLFFVYMLALAQSNRTAIASRFQLLIMLVLGYVFLPIYLTLPHYFSISTTRFTTAYLDMVSAFTTTGFVVFEPYRLNETLHLWRASVGWFGGAIVWVSALSVLAPEGFSGGETRDTKPIGSLGERTTIDRHAALQRNIRAFIPFYFGFTLMLWVALTSLSVAPFEGFIIALSVLSTSGIVGQFDLTSLTPSVPVEALIFFFLCLALYRRRGSEKREQLSLSTIRRSDEVQLAFYLIVSFTALLITFQALNSFERSEGGNIFDFSIAIWSNIFTLTSFLTTLGWVSAYSDMVQVWGGVSVPAMILLGLALIGGGAATTAGGIKLARIYALYANALHETGRLLHPSAVGYSVNHASTKRRQDAFRAWVFFMLFIITMSLVTLGLALAGLSFEAALVGAISAMSTTGPLISVFENAQINFTSLNWFGSSVFGIAMILGRLEVLVLLSLFNMQMWQR